MRLVENADLSLANTLQVPSHARWLLDIESLKDLHVLNDPRWDGRAMHILGGGSNVVLGERIDGVVVRAALRGIEIHTLPDSVEVSVGAGESWIALVQSLSEQGIGGLENLGLIPGLVGASPVQNIGAYGVEFAQRFAWLQAFDLERGELRRLNSQDCAFGYRDSVFKRNPNRWLILTVRMRLPRPWRAELDYAGLKEALGDETPSPNSIHHAVVRLRTAKLPDPALIPNAGSFFKNPEVTPDLVERLRVRYAQMPAYPTAKTDRKKLSAAWLIEQAGWRGRKLGQVQVSAQHALVITNEQRAGGREILELAAAITRDVEAQFSVVLEREPVCIG